MRLFSKSLKQQVNGISGDEKGALRRQSIHFFGLLRFMVWQKKGGSGLPLLHAPPQAPF